ncbi:MAG: hypothetical protein FWG87_03180 [Defluviitaleaceae bacterium]|nr:hypothetical protein [Defluviitaleaceae bacterium]
MKKSAIKKQRDLQQKKVQRQNFITIAVLVLVVALVAGLAALQLIKESNSTVYDLDGQTVTLYPDGKFAAVLGHGVTKSGTYTQTEPESITFTQRNGTVENATIVDDILHVPYAWEDSCRLGTAFPRRTR